MCAGLVVTSEKDLLLFFLNLLLLHICSGFKKGKADTNQMVYSSSLIV